MNRESTLAILSFIETSKADFRNSVSLPIAISEGVLLGGKITL